MKIFGDNHAVNLSGERSTVIAALLTRWRGFVRGSLAAFVPVLAACCVLAILVAFQVLFVGGMDVLGFAPQVSLLSLNLVLIALFLSLTLPTQRLRLMDRRRRKSVIAEVGVANARALSLNAVSPARPTCKVLVIKRLAQGAHTERREAWRVFAKDEERHEVGYDA